MQKFLRASLLMLAGLVLLIQPALAARSERLVKILRPFESHAQMGLEAWDIPGMALAIVEGAEIVYARGWGVREYGKKQLVDPDTVFQIGSISKSFTTLLVGMQADAGKLAFTDRVIDHLPEFRTADPWVTRGFKIEDMLAQRSGLPTCGGDLQVMFGNTRDQVIGNIHHIKPVTGFRSEFAYQNNFFLAAAAMVEKQTGSSWGDDVKKRVFAPLGLEQTFVTSGEYLSISNRAAQHQRLDNEIVILPGDWPFQFAVETFAPAGAISSSARNLATYMALHMNMGKHKDRQLVSERSMAHIHSPKTPIGHGRPGRRQYYCQGLILSSHQGRELVWHNGGTPGGKSVLMFDSQTKVGIVILTNMQGTMLPDLLALDFFDMYFGISLTDRVAKVARAMHQANHNTRPPAQPVPAAPARKMSAYCGSFANGICGPVRVFVKGGKLKVTLGSVPMEHTLTHHDGDTFWMPLPLVDVEASGFARFEFDPQGVPQRLVIDAFQENAIPPFERMDDQ